MQEIKDLILDGEDLYIVYGDLKVTGEVRIKDSIVIVSGALIFKDCVNKNIHIEGSDIFAGAIIVDSDFENDIIINDGNIWTSHNLLTNNYCIESDGDIEVGGNANVRHVECRDYVVLNENDSWSIEARSIYIEGDNDSSDLKALDIYLGSNAKLNGYSIEAKSGFLCVGKIYNCIGFSVG